MYLKALRVNAAVTRQRATLDDYMTRHWKGLARASGIRVQVTRVDGLRRQIFIPIRDQSPETKRSSASSQSRQINTHEQHFITDVREYFSSLEFSTRDSFRRQAQDVSNENLMSGVKSGLEKPSVFLSVSSVRFRAGPIQ